MGPIRRRLILALALLGPAPAAAQSVCDAARPNWNGAPVGAIGEFLILLQTPLVLILIIATALVLRLRSEWGGLACVLGWSGATFLAVGWANSAGHTAARAEGCVGNPALFIGMVVLVCIGIVLYTAPLKRSDTSQE